MALPHSIRHRSRTSIRRLAAFASLLLPTLHCGAQSPPGPVVLRVWGTGTHDHSPLLPVLLQLEARFHTQHTEVRFENYLRGDDSALGGLYTGAADLTLLQRPPSYIELDGYQQVLTREAPLSHTILLGNTPGHSSPLVLIVNANNPLPSLSLTQVAALFHPSSTALLFGFHPDSPEGQSFAALLPGGLIRWPCAYHVQGTSSGGLDAAVRIVRHVALDPRALGLTTLDAVSPAVRVVPILDASGTPRTPTTAALEAGQYPFARGILALIPNSPGPTAANLQARQFLTFLSTPDASAIIRADGSYLPAPPEAGKP